MQEYEMDLGVLDSYFLRRLVEPIPNDYESECDFLRDFVDFLHSCVEREVEAGKRDDVVVEYKEIYDIYIEAFIESALDDYIERNCYGNVYYDFERGAMQEAVDRIWNKWGFRLMREYRDFVNLCLVDLEIKE